MPKAEGFSLRRRLFIRLLGVLAVLTAGLFLFVSAYAQRAADAAFDRLLMASALSISDTVRVEDGRFSVDLPYSSLGILAQARRDRVFYRITAPDGELVTGYHDLPVAPAKAGVAGASGGDPATRFENASFRGMPVRIAVLKRFAAQPELGGWITIAVAQTREERGALARDILANAFLPIAFTVVAAGGLIWFGVRQALAPLGSLERMIRERQPHDFSPIAMPPPQEVSQLVQAINQLMARLQSNLDTMQTFLADAAHQIRTPLASLRLQAELAIDEDDPDALHRIAQRVHRNAVEASQLTSQLLNHAMVIHRSEALKPEDVDLGALLEQVFQRARAVAGDTAIRLDIDRAAEPATVPGDAISLREALTNLLDNAVKYAGPSGPIDLTLTPRPDGRGLRVEIVDRGPGVPDAEKRRVLERFGRGSSAAGVAGSGLGLAIVSSVVEAHGAAFALLDRPGGGLVARIDFPEAGGAAPAGGGAARALLPLLVLVTLLWAPWAQAAQLLTYPAPGGERERLRIHSATDRQAIEPLVLDFQQLRPDVTIEYKDMDTADLYAEAVATPAKGTAETPDLLISSASDLQVKLVNDGFTQPHRSALTDALPDWANWRDEAFGFTFEPAVIAYNRDLLPDAEVPRTRPALIRLLRDDPVRFGRRVATYDTATSGIGYLLAAHDALLFGQYWQLVAMMGNAQARLACCSGDILDLVERGEVLIAYNVLGSYARARAAAGAAIGIVVPEDYTLVISRVAVIPKTAPRPQLAGAFIDYLLSPRGQEVVADRSALYAISSGIKREASASGLRSSTAAPLHPIALSPALLVFLDRLKRERFLQQWQSAILLP
ncbi:extracellular solute-binding protein [Azospirillum brasilense]|uniref:histidine kinase n=1 Tax=Azospirillum brasilense TaxID=192 RepID=A0A4D8QVS8_AZOBR|nr:MULTISPECIES: extracellular solute-binding protein [Azospirillum]MDW7596682.1 extracellular solute-binding protein [Azospirillum brasilense]MDW7631563.1 extracellular solute-binding protein [Azospirillum brasilense]MDX5950322.1 extracellular solute-binding protein [Azospirillum brasilense]OPH12979.1 histidine kinase [Azospirillum brasilense]OPH20712.1 histidine kinase [Azospirillum brasilense]